MRYGKAIFTSKNLQNCDEPHFHDKQDPKKTKVHIFSRLHGIYDVEARKNGDFCFFFFKYKIENNDFITILGSVINKGMMFTTIFLLKSES